MRATRPMEGDPWPHDMVLRIEDDPQPLLDLLWVREAWGLHPAGDVLPLLVDTPSQAGDTDERGEWEAAWPDMWRDAVRHAGSTDGPALIERLLRPDLTPDERAELLRRLDGPGWRDRFGDDAFDEGYDAWTSRRFEARLDRRPRRVEETPERRSLPALIAAWEAGLTHVVTIPCSGDFTRILGPDALLVTEATRGDPAGYTHALEAFARG